MMNAFCSELNKRAVTTRGQSSLAAIDEAVSDPHRCVHKRTWDGLEALLTRRELQRPLENVERFVLTMMDMWRWRVPRLASDNNRTPVSP